VAGLAAISADEARVAIEGLAAELATAPSKEQLAAVHEALMQAVAVDDSLAGPVVAAAAEALAGVDPELVGGLIDTLPTRSRVALRLLRAGSSEAAALVLADNATGVVTTPFQAATSSGAPRTGWRLPLLTVIDAGRIFADLPGFRDPRFGAPDECFDISTAVKLRAHLDDAIPGRRLALGGWAAIDIVRSHPGETVRVVAAKGGRELAWPAVRHRRADLVSGTGEGLHRRAWAGWSAELDHAPLGEDNGTWTLSLEVEHDGLQRRTRLGTSVGELAARAAGGLWRPDRPKIRVDARKGGWALVVS